MSEKSSRPPGRISVAAAFGDPQSRTSPQGEDARAAGSDSGMVFEVKRLDAGQWVGPGGSRIALTCDLPDHPVRAYNLDAIGRSHDSALWQRMSKRVWPTAGAATSPDMVKLVGSPEDLLLSAIFGAEGDVQEEDFLVEDGDVSESLRELASRIESLHETSPHIDRRQNQTAAAIAELKTQIAAVNSAVAFVVQMLAQDRDDRRETRAQLARIEDKLDRSSTSAVDDFGPLEFVGGTRPAPTDRSGVAARPAAPDDEPLRLKDDPAWLDSAAFAEAMGVTPQAVHQKRARGEVVGISQGGRKVYFPLSQIGAAGGPLPGLMEVIALLDGDALEVDRTLRRSGPEFGQSTARDALIAGRREQVLTALRAMREGGFS